MTVFTAAERQTIANAARIRRDARKAAAKARPKSPKADRGRVRDNGYLQFIRRQPCTCCKAAAPNDAAHLRMASPRHGKQSTGMQVKPSDRFAVPLCRTCHTTQHAGSEARFWAERGLDPFEVADALFASYTQGDR